MCYIIQLCCNGCKQFISFRICPVKDYMDFIRKNYDNYKDYYYLIYYGDSCCDTIDGVEL